MEHSRADRFRSLHHRPEPLLLGNAWDIGSAKILESLGFEAIATTSSGFAATMGEDDGQVGRNRALAHARSLVETVEIPVSADLENGFAHSPAGVAETVKLALEAGLAGCSIEDYTGSKEEPIYPIGDAVDRIRAAADAGHARGQSLLLTARSENYLHGHSDLGDTIDRLQRYADAGADVVYAPGLTSLDDIERLVRSVKVPVNVLVLPDGPEIDQLASVGVRRISVGGAFAFAALGALVESARQLQSGNIQFLQLARMGSSAFRSAISTERTGA